MLSGPSGSKSNGAAPYAAIVSPMRYVTNDTHTYLPTYGTYDDYFRIEYCNAECFAEKEMSAHHIFTRGIARCCSYYGQCRLKDDYRTYAVVLLTLLMVLSYVVRVVLLASAWRRLIACDDGAIDAFLRNRRESRRSRRSRGLPTPPSNARLPPQTTVALEQNCVESAVSSSATPGLGGPPLLWNLQQYDAWRYEAERARWAAERVAVRSAVTVEGGRGPGEEETLSSTRENPLSL